MLRRFFGNGMMGLDQWTRRWMKYSRRGMCLWIREVIPSYEAYSVPVEAIHSCGR
jgi:hypothetical protein